MVSCRARKMASGSRARQRDPCRESLVVADHDWMKPAPPLVEQAQPLVVARARVRRRSRPRCARRRKPRRRAGAGAPASSATRPENFRNAIARAPRRRRRPAAARRLRSLSTTAFRATPARWLAARAIVNSRSDRRLSRRSRPARPRLCRAAAPSARRAGTPCARDAATRRAAAAVRQDEMPQRRDLGVEPIDPALEPRDAAVVDDDLLDALGDLVRRIGQPRAEREQVALQRQAHLVEIRRQARRRATTPRQACTSSTSP